jgi:hypothetical protein
MQPASNSSIDICDSAPKSDWDQSKLLEMLRLYSEEERHWLQEHHSRAIYYTSLLTSVAGAILFGYFNIKAPTHFIIICVGSLTLTLLAKRAAKGMRRLYRRYLEAITMRAKIEQWLGLMAPINGELAYWRGESLIPQRFRDARSAHATSADFVNANERLGYQEITEDVFSIFAVLGLSSCLVSISLALLGIIMPSLKLV